MKESRDPDAEPARSGKLMLTADPSRLPGRIRSAVRFLPPPQGPQEIQRLTALHGLKELLK